MVPLIGLDPRPTKAPSMLVYVHSIALENRVASGRSDPSLSRHSRASLSRSLDGELHPKLSSIPVSRVHQTVIVARKIKRIARSQVRKVIALWMLTMLLASPALLVLLLALFPLLPLSRLPFPNFKLSLSLKPKLILSLRPSLLQPELSSFFRSFTFCIRSRFPSGNLFFSFMLFLMGNIFRGSDYRRPYCFVDTEVRCIRISLA